VAIPARGARRRLARSSRIRPAGSVQEQPRCAGASHRAMADNVTCSSPERAGMIPLLLRTARQNRGQLLARQRQASVWPPCEASSAAQRTSPALNSDKQVIAGATRPGGRATTRPESPRSLRRLSVRWMGIQRSVAVLGPWSLAECGESMTPRHPVCPLGLLVSSRSAPR
jgi:hypothetical protein